jgi:NAD(P)-dependent dehydrogenase (short-subunit alcohol dehydrogenase family)
MSKIAVICGGSAGVGRAVLDQFMERGYRTAVIARGEDRLAEIEAEFGDRVWTRALDVSDDAGMTRAAEDIRAHWGAPDIWVNCAMLTSVSPFEEMTDDEFRKITDATYMGQVVGTRAALKVMERGNIVCVGSGLSYRAIPYQSAYCAAKHAVNGFAQAVRTEMIHKGRPIEVSLVQLPAINTPQFDWSRNRLTKKPQPVPPIFQPEVAAQGVLKAIDTNAREILVGRSVVQLIFGNYLAPDLLDRQLGNMGVDAQKSDEHDYGRPDNIDGPVAMPSRAHGSFDDQAERSGIVLDADRTRKGFAIGGALALFGLGLLVGRSRRPAARPRVAEDRPRREDRAWETARLPEHDAGKLEPARAGERAEPHLAWGEPRLPADYHSDRRA